MLLQFSSEWDRILVTIFSSLKQHRKPYSAALYFILNIFCLHAILMYLEFVTRELLCWHSLFKGNIQQMLHNAAFESIFKGMGWGGNKLWNQFRKLFGVPFFRVCTLFCNVLHEDDLTSLLCYFHINSQFVTWITPPLQEIDAVFPSVKMAEESHRVYAPHWGYSAFFSIRCQLFWAAEYIDTVQILTFQDAKI